MDVAVTGAAGFIGTHLTRRLCADDRVHFVKAIDLSCGDSEVFSHHKVVFSQGDLADQCELRSVLRGVDTVFHLASHLEPEGNTREHSATSQNCRTTSLLLKAASLSGVRRVVLASSAAIYGEQETFPIRESAQANPISFNGRSKAALERSVENHNRETRLDCVVLRLFNVYGHELRERRNTNMFVHRLFEAARNNKVLSITGDGNQTRDFVHVDDVVEAFSVGAFAPLVPGSNRVFNVGTGEEISVLAIVRLLEQVSGVKVTTVFASAADDREPSRSVADVTMSRRHLGFSAQVQVSDGLRRVWNAMRDAMPSAIEESRLCS